MGGYTKNIAVIKGVAGGFSADGGALSGLVRAEKFGGYLRVSVTLINFAPLSGGRYVTAVTDGANSEVFEGAGGELASKLDTSFGFAAAVCFVNGGVKPVAAAVCGDMAWAVPLAVHAAESAESPAQGYEDEALAEDNYYEYGDDIKGEGTVCEDGQEEEPAACKDEADSGVRKGQKGAFWSRLSGEIEGLLSQWPHERALEQTVSDSRWVRITYGTKSYVFGVIEEDGAPAYICYGVPAKICPESLKGLASFIPAGGGYWVMYQSADDGGTVRVSG